MSESGDGYTTHQGDDGSSDTWTGSRQYEKTIKKTHLKRPTAQNNNLSWKEKTMCFEALIFSKLTKLCEIKLNPFSVWKRKNPSCFFRVLRFAFT